MPSDPNAISIRFTEPHERDLPQFSHSIMEAVLTCPVWGIIRYVKRLYYPTARQIPLEAGSAFHEVAAACRLWQLLRLQNLPEHFAYHGRRLFNHRDETTGAIEPGPGRFEFCWKEIPDSQRDELINFCFNILNSGEFYDDPSDTTRTISNLETTIIRYVDDRLPHMSANPIWVMDVSNPSALVGIEITYDVMVTWLGRSVRYIGTIDGICLPDSLNGDFRVDDNKTASRLDETWRKAWNTKNQPNGYIAAARLITGLEGDSFRVIGIKVKQTRSAEDILAFIDTRTPSQMQDWVRSLFQAVDFVEQYHNKPLAAPQFTQSCSRYFRPCAFIDLCGADPDDREYILGTMVQAPLTPTQLALQERYDADANR